MARKKPLTKNEIADYLQQSDVAAITARFALPGSNVVRALREVVARLKTA